jgi:hypothetical protein
MAELSKEGTTCQHEPLHGLNESPTDEELQQHEEDQAQSDQEHHV